MDDNPLIVISGKDLDSFKREILNGVEALKNETIESKFRLMRSKDVMKELGISSSQLQKWRIKGVVPYSKIDDTIFYSREEIKKLLDQNASNKN